MKKEWLNKVGLLGVIIYGASLFFSKGGMNIGLGLMIIGLFSIDIKKAVKEYDLILKYFLFVIVITPIWALFSDGGLESGIKAFEKVYRFIPAFLGILYVTNIKRIGYLFNALSFSVFVNFLSGIDFYRSKNWNLKIRYSGLIENPLDNGHVASALFFVFLVGGVYFYRRNKKVCIACISGGILSFIILILSQGRGAWLAFLGGIGIVMILKLDIKKLCGIVLISILGFTMISQTNIYKNNIYVRRLESIKSYKKDDSSLIRIIMWKGVIDSYKKNPIFGVGRDNLDKWLPLYIKENNSARELNWKWHETALNEIANAGNPHNMYMVALGEMGIMSLSLFIFWIWVYVDSILTYVKNKKVMISTLILAVIGSFTSLYITGLTESSWRNIWKGNTYIVVLILYFALKKIIKEEKNEKDSF